MKTASPWWRLEPSTRRRLHLVQRADQLLQLVLEDFLFRDLGQRDQVVDDLVLEDAAQLLLDLLVLLTNSK